jgi:hypothetical protein
MDAVLVVVGFAPRQRIARRIAIGSRGPGGVASKRFGG